MGLDSVELLMEWEKYFDIEIPDLEAEKIATVQDAVENIAKHLNIVDNDLALQDKVFAQLRQAFSKLGRHADFKKSDLLIQFIPNDAEIFWTQLTEALKLDVPSPAKELKEIFFGRILKQISPPVKFKYEQFSFGQFIDIICSNNYERLIDNHNITSKYEIYIAIMAITVDKIGIDFYEFAPEKTFSGDFGID